METLSCSSAGECKNEPLRDLSLNEVMPHSPQSRLPARRALLEYAEEKFCKTRFCAEWQRQVWRLKFFKCNDSHRKMLFCEERGEQVTRVISKEA